MAEPKKETVRIALPPRPAITPVSQEGAKRDTARIVLPSRTPAIPPRRTPPVITPSPSVGNGTAAETPIVALRRPPVLPPRTATVSPVLQPLPKPPGTGILPDASEAEAESVTPASKPATFENHIGAPAERGPKKETARINILPRPAAAPRPAVNMTKTQPLIMHPTGTTVPPVIVATSKTSDPFDSIPRSFCWGLLGISAIIFLIQIWNYFSI
jgi:hypothetical protein